MADLNTNIFLRLIDGASAGLAKVRRGLADVSKEMSVAQKNSELLQKKFESIGTFGRSLSIGAGLVAGAFGLMGKAALSAAGYMEQQRISLTTMLGSAQEAQLLLKKINDMAVKSPFELKDLVDYGKQLLATGSTIDQIIPRLKILGDISAGVGLEKMPFIIKAFTDVQNKGKLYAQELRQFNENGVPILYALAKAHQTAGESIEQAKQRIANGIEAGKIRVSAQEVESVLRSLTQKGGMFYDMQAKQAETFAGKLSNIKDNINRAFTGFGNALLPAAKIIESILEKTIGALASLDPRFKAILASIGAIVFALSGLALSIGVVLAVLPTFSAGLSVLSTSVTILGLSFSAVPIIGWTSALITAGVVIYQFRDKIAGVLVPALKSVASFFGAKDFAKKLDNYMPKNQEPAEQKQNKQMPNIKTLTKDFEKQLTTSQGAKQTTEQKQKEQKQNESKEVDELLKKTNQMIEMRKIYGDITLKQERDLYSKILDHTKASEEQKLQIRQKMFELDKEIAKQKLDNDRYLWSEEQKMLTEREQFLKLNRDLGMTETKMSAKMFLDIARNKAKEEISLDKSLMAASKEYANQQLDLKKAEVIAWVDMEAGKWAIDGSARLAASLGLDPTGWALLAAAGAATIGIRQIASQVKLAKGGIVQPTPGGTVATIGEAGVAEAVIPLDSPRANNMLGNFNDTNSGPVTINVMVESTTLAKVVYKNIRELQRNGQIASGL